MIRRWSLGHKGSAWPPRRGRELGMESNHMADDSVTLHNEPPVKLWTQKPGWASQVVILGVHHHRWPWEAERPEDTAASHGDPPWPCPSLPLAISVSILSLSNICTFQISVTCSSKLFSLWGAVGSLKLVEGALLWECVWRAWTCSGVFSEGGLMQKVPSDSALWPYSFEIILSDLFFIYSHTSRVTNDWCIGSQHWKVVMMKHWKEAFNYCATLTNIPYAYIHASQLSDWTELNASI